TDGPWDRLDYLRVSPDLPQNSNDDEDQDDDEQEVDEVSRPRDGGNARGPEVPQQPEDDQDHDEQLEHVSLRSITRCGDVRSYRRQPTKSTPRRSTVTRDDRRCTVATCFPSNEMKGNGAGPARGRAPRRSRWPPHPSLPWTRGARSAGVRSCPSARAGVSWPKISMPCLSIGG